MHTETEVDITILWLEGNFCPLKVCQPTVLEVYLFKGKFPVFGVH